MSHGAVDVTVISGDKFCAVLCMTSKAVGVAKTNQGIASILCRLHFNVLVCGQLSDI